VEYAQDAAWCVAFGIIVNRPLLQTVAICLTSARCGDRAANDRRLTSQKASKNVIGSCFVQILGKLYFLQLSENLRRILVDYAQKRPRRANPDFNAGC
jgi:hypothetical protein